ncbi:MAG TPA: YgjV family protein [Candidatus Sulfotelmatobacter sp.]|nr:YgjV family protein [Candidatus Sulfotelmatobacter sp.]
MQFFSPAQCVGYVAFVLGVSAFLQKDDRRLKLLVAGECLAYTVHFWLLGNLAASLSACTSCGRCLLAIKTRSRLLAALIVGINLTLGVIFAKTQAAWLPVTASCLGTIAVFMLQGIAMRLVLLVCTFLWLANNIISGSIGGTLLETVIAIANISTMARLFLVHRPEIATGDGKPAQSCSPTLASQTVGAKPNRPATASW